MAKDPAFLFYPGDYLRDTQCLSEKVQVAYDRIMCEHMRNLCITDQQLKFFTKKLDDDEKEELLMVLSEVEGGYQIVWVVESIIKRRAFTESRRRSRLKSDEDNVRIYIVRDNVRLTYKIGSSVNPIRRYNELNNQKKPAIMGDKKPADRDITLVWYSDPVKRVEEKELHNYFSNKNIAGEWFNLDSADLEYIYKKHKGSYEERTKQRTEIANEDENEDLKEVLKEIEEKPKDLKEEILEYFKGRGYPEEEAEEFYDHSKTWLTPGSSVVMNWQLKAEDWHRLEAEFNVFNEARELYPGTKRGGETELNNLVKKHKDYKTVIPLIKPSILRQIQWRKELKIQKEFVPTWKNFQTWINNRSWEDEVPVHDLKVYNKPDYKSRDVLCTCNCGEKPRMTIEGKPFYSREHYEKWKVDQKTFLAGLNIVDMKTEENQRRIDKAKEIKDKKDKAKNLEKENE